MISIKDKLTPQIIEWYWGGAEKFLKRRIKNNFKSAKSKHSFLKNFLYENLKDIVLGNPYDLEGIRSRFPAEVSENEEVLKKIFDYNRFVNYRNDLWDAYTLAEKLDVPTCPYCNIQYTHTVRDRRENKDITRPQFDHFLDKGSNPIFALSIYNLIPSCSICNLGKSTENFSVHSHVHPYIGGFETRMKFDIKISKYSFFYGDVEGAKIIFRKTSICSDKFEKKAQRNIKDFKLENLYKKHRYLVSELLQKSLIYDAKYRKELYKKYVKNLIDDDKQLSKFVIGNFITNEELLLRPLSKLTKDVVEQFELWK